MIKNVLIVAGEVSGDIHSANLINDLKKLNPNLRLYGIGGKRMEAQGVELLENVENMSIIGVSEVFAKLKHIRQAFKKVLDKVSQAPPSIVILVDYPGFNLRLARILKKKGLPIIYYITPQVWAWGRSRVHHIKKYVDKAIVILKFEEELFKEYGIDATFVGHPLLDDKAHGTYDKIACGLDGKKATLALLPGSRKSEVSSLLPIMLQTIELVAKEKELQFILLRSTGVEDALYDKILKGSKLPIVSIKDDTHKCLSLADFVFTSSGTATLESAIMEKPMLITYKTSFLTALLFKIFARTPFIGLVNIIAGRSVVPEILQYDAKPKRLASEILSIITSKDRADKQVEGLKEVKASLGTSGASKRAAQIIDRFIT
ncbi:MAG: lipid-A-disaccharide synthase [Candidatus Omnitrophota bacterium]